MHPSIDRIFLGHPLAVALLRVVRRLFEHRQQSRRGAGAVLFENPAEDPEGPVQSRDHAREVFVPALGRSRRPLEVGKPRLQIGQHPCASRLPSALAMPAAGRVVGNWGHGLTPASPRTIRPVEKNSPGGVGEEGVGRLTKRRVRDVRRVERHAVARNITVAAMPAAVSSAVTVISAIPLSLIHI